MRFDLPWVQVWAMDRGRNSQTSYANARSYVASERIGPSHQGKRASSKIRHGTLPQSAVLSGTRSRFFPLLRPHGSADCRGRMPGSASVPPSQQPTSVDKVQPWANHRVLQPPVDG